MVEISSIKFTYHGSCVCHDLFTNEPGIYLFIGNFKSHYSTDFTKIGHKQLAYKQMCILLKRLWTFLERYMFGDKIFEKYIIT